MLKVVSGCSTKVFDYDVYVGDPILRHANYRGIDQNISAQASDFVVARSVGLIGRGAERAHGYNESYLLKKSMLAHNAAFGAVQPLPAHSGERVFCVQNLLNVQRTSLWRFVGQALWVLQVLTGLIEHFLQHVVVLVHLHKLFQNDLAETLSPRRQTTEAVMYRG
jgi:hypothetical protein